MRQQSNNEGDSESQHRLSPGTVTSQTLVTVVLPLPASSQPDTNGARTAKTAAVADAFADSACKHQGRMVPRGPSLGAAFSNARDAVACALEVHRRCAAELGTPDARLALHAGEVVDAEGELLGEGVIAAAALASAVTPGEVWCTASVRELAAGLAGVEFVSHGSVNAFLFDHPFPVFRLVAVADVGARRTRLVGRDRERGELRQSLRRALVGRGELVVLTGEAGVGKTYLAEDLANEALAFGARVLTGRGQQDATLPYLPFVEMLDALLPEMQSPE
ncbi:MAG: AAA family ATPase, partial [Actinomycetota bacterium]|nr:AAA family ATPase [Actinomycetota bacterium]